MSKLLGEQGIFMRPCNYLKLEKQNMGKQKAKFLSLNNMFFFWKEDDKVHYLKEYGSARNRVSHLLLISQINKNKMMKPY